MVPNHFACVGFSIVLFSFDCRPLAINVRATWRFFMKLLILSLICLFGAVTNAQPAPPNGESVWGTQGLKVNLNFKVGAKAGKQAKGGTIEYDCARMTLSNVLTSGTGSFMADGSLLSQAGNQRRDAPPRTPTKTKVFGTVYNVNQMTLIVVRENDAPTPDVYNIEGGVNPILHKCL
jgi:hypothetical protein